ncbi:hypothetical protein [Jiangella alba]|uniref:Uncharacterized protein n=1 Tax=Jiangella alba TaxID=561176 RepID=A0A1H5IDA8_9ACTN|nr:hypothetical protein [Jiangella alba]SEE38176.1 hypothetical protein SAMN04488561_1155 [Jiangella alba]
MERKALLALGLVLLAVIALGAVALQRQSDRIDELEAAVGELRVRADDAGRPGGLDDTARLDEIERQLGFDAPSWPTEDIHERIAQLEWGLSLICGHLHRNGAEVLC